MDAASPEARDAFHAELRIAADATETATVPKTRSAQQSLWADWVAFCRTYGHAANLPNVPDQETKLCYLLVFASHRRNTRTGRGGKPIRSKTISASLQHVGKGITLMGDPDPRLATPGVPKFHPLLDDYLKALEREDDPQSRAHPANITIVRNLTTVQPPTAHSQHVALLCIVGFYWLLRPAEYLSGQGQGRSEAFKLGDASFEIDGKIYNATDASLNDVDVNRIQRASLTFADQKNAVKGEQITHAANLDPVLCPCKALARICAHLRAHGASPRAAIYYYYNASGRRQRVTPEHVTAALRSSASKLQDTTGISPALLSARSLRPGGATALLCANVDPNIIQLLGRWQSDAMLRYLRVAALAQSTNLSQQMLVAGAYTFAPNTCTANHHQPVPVQAPAEFITALERQNLYHS